MKQKNKQTSAFIISITIFLIVQSKVFINHKLIQLFALYFFGRENNKNFEPNEMCVVLGNSIQQKK